MKKLFILLFLFITLGTNAQNNKVSGLNARQFHKYWKVESESPDYKVTFQGDTAEILSPKGLTLWRKEKMSGRVTIEYDACVVVEKEGDRLSDLNCFWMASDPKHPDNIWKREKWRSGIFLNCYSLQLYYMGYGGNYNSTTRFRRYDGNEAGIADPKIRPAIWKEYTDQIEISIINPSGVRVGPVPEILGPHRFRIGQTEILLYYGEPSPYSISQEIYIDLLPVESYLTEGIWRIVLSAGKIVTGQYEMWLPSDNVLNRGTGFLFPTDATTLTIPSSASRAISVGAYDARTFAYADFSGRGFTRLTNMVKPDLVAPGVEVMTTTVGGGYAAFTGTSFATPFVTGSAALLMEWGIVRGNDPYLYGEKVKAYLRRGAKKVPGFDEYPNEEVGYGALCTAQSIPYM